MLSASPTPAMTAGAFATLAGRWPAPAAAAAAAGALFFFFSDAMLAWNRFVEPFRYGQAVTLLLYWLRQLGIALRARWGGGWETSSMVIFSPLLAPGPPGGGSPTLDTRAAPPGRLPISTVVERMQHNYDEAKDFRARFSQKFTNVAFGRTKVSAGQITFKKPGRMRWDYDAPEAKMFLSTGQLL